MSKTHLKRMIVKHTSKRAGDRMSKHQNVSRLKQSCFILLFVNSMYQSVAMVQQQNIEKGKKISEIFPFFN